MELKKFVPYLEQMLTFWAGVKGIEEKNAPPMVYLASLLSQTLWGG